MAKGREGGGRDGGRGRWTRIALAHRARNGVVDDTELAAARARRRRAPEALGGRGAGEGGAVGWEPSWSGGTERHPDSWLCA